MSPRSRTLIVTGAGGVGKTTVSAALGVHAARNGTRTLVLTIDPARRLADALGIAKLGNDPAPVKTQPGLWAAMLDVTASWEAILDRHTEPEIATRLRSNAFFRAIADRFPAAQAYAAGEQLADYLEAGAWELIIVDTPPAGGGIDFFAAPNRMSELVGGRVLRFLTGAGLPGRRALYRFTARPVLKVADAVLGGPLLEDLAEFLLDLRTLYDGLTMRAATIERYLSAARVIVATTAQPSAMREAARFYDELPGIVVKPAGVVFNRVLPAEWIGLKPGMPSNGFTPEQAAELRDNLRNWAAEAHRQADARAELASQYTTATATIPWRHHAPTTLDALADLITSSDGLAVLTGLD
ncbi:MAG: ArsA-related P-loop ATPase [Acidimicrobiia bacterium]|nr:ArsA-related P-loop ATPase [Acidimicrobiia bacterium]